MSKPPNAARQVTISKSLSWILRHGAEKEGIRMNAGGWANVADILSWRKLAAQKVTFAELCSLVENNDKQRFSLMSVDALNNEQTDTSSPSPRKFMIRANQGHSLRSIDDNETTAPLDPSDPQCPSQVVHGTYGPAWDAIQVSGGLKPMTRRMVHFAAGVPGQDACKVISGMRQNCTILIWVDLKRSLNAGIKWWVSANHVYLTEGSQGLLSLEWVSRVEDRAGRVIWPTEQPVQTPS